MIWADELRHFVTCNTDEVICCLHDDTCDYYTNDQFKDFERRIKSFIGKLYTRTTADNIISAVRKELK